MTESPHAWERWMVAGSEIARVLLEFEASFSTPSDTTTGNHHEQSDCTHLTFANDVLLCWQHLRTCETHSLKTVDTC